MVQQADRQADDERAEDQFRRQLHRMWAEVAGGWAEHAEDVDARSAQLTQRMIELSTPRRGEGVLELACGPGGAGLAAAEQVGPGGEVVLSDIAAEMTAIASERAAARGLRNVTARVLDLEQIDEPDGSYDVVLCREGLMLVPDPERAMWEIRRVLRPGGRVALAVWGPRERNPWLGVMFDAMSAQLGCRVPPAGVPGPFSLANVEELGALLRDAELSEVSVTELSVPLRAGSFGEWWTARCALAGPLTTILASLPADVRDLIRARAEEAARPYETRDGLEFPGVALLASGRHP
jgi:SAM-dependent methyltransferase